MDALDSYDLAPASPLNVTRDATPPGDPDAIRAVFTQGVVSFFAERPGWHVESAGGRLAVWRDLHVERPADCPTLLADAMTIRRLLLARSR